MDLTYKVTCTIIGMCSCGELDKLHVQTLNNVVPYLFHGCLAFKQKYVCIMLTVRQTQHAEKHS